MNVGIVGAGRQGWRRARSLDSEDGDRLLGVADVNHEAARQLGREFGVQAMDRWERVVEDPEIEVVFICTPPNLHALIGVAALQQGKHVLCEKPLGHTVQDGEALVVAARLASRKLKCGFNHRHFPAIRQAKEWCDEEAIGELTHVRCRYGIGGQVGYDKDWRACREISGGGELMDQGVHGLDLCRWFLGEFSEAFAFLSTAFWDIAPLEDNAFVLLRTPKGQVASLHASWTQWKNLFSFEVFGKDGFIHVEGLGGSYGTQGAALCRREFFKPFEEQTIEYRGEYPSWREEWQEFKAAIREEREPLGNGADGLAALRLADALYRSAARGELIAVG
ncbi:MAG: Gfo/Idh/MocA family oxidoreductase [Chloroflexota bacterium]|nr:Gfo/Idh/MocA family oxidoreductase [Chloroflexota bacterium]